MHRQCASHSRKPLPLEALPARGRVDQVGGQLPEAALQKSPAHRPHDSVYICIHSHGYEYVLVLDVPRHHHICSTARVWLSALICPQVRAAKPCRSSRSNSSRAAEAERPSRRLVRDPRGWLALQPIPCPRALTIDSAVEFRVYHCAAS